MVFLVLGIIGLFIGVVLFVSGKKAQKKALSLYATENFTAGALQSLYRSVAGEIGTGSFRRMVNLHGTVESPNPLTAEVSGKPCVAYRTEVEREIEETYYETNSKTGARERKTRRTKATVSSNRRSIPFTLQDEDGTVTVNPEGTQPDMVKILDKYEPANSPNVQLTGNAVTWERHTFRAVSGVALGMSMPREGQRILGYSFREYILPLNQAVFIHGEATDEPGTLQIAKPSARGENFIISRRTKEQVITSSQKHSRTASLAAPILFVVGAVLIIAGIVVR